MYAKVIDVTLSENWNPYTEDTAYLDVDSFKEMISDRDIDRFRCAVILKHQLLPISSWGFLSSTIHFSFTAILPVQKAFEAGQKIQIIYI